MVTERDYGLRRLRRVAWLRYQIQNVSQINSNKLKSCTTTKVATSQCLQSVALKLGGFARKLARFGLPVASECGKFPMAIFDVPTFLHVM